MINENTLKFETAWDVPHPVLKVLSEKFPTVPFRISWANEDFGIDVGTVTFLAGKVSEKDLPRPESARAYEMAAKLWNINLADLNYRLDPKHGTYVYDESMAKARESEHPPLAEQIKTASARAEENRTPERAMTAIREGYGEFALYPNEDLEGISLVHGGGQVKVDGVLYDLQKPLSMSDCIKMDKIPNRPERHKVDDYLPHRDSYGSYR